ncbi:MAG: exosortase/archaeosortase family protein [Acidimicrobiia bacterium]
MTALSIPGPRRLRISGSTAPDAPGRPSDRSTAWRVAALLLLVTIAYHYSLQTLIRTVKVETPLAYLGLVPIIALALAVSRRAPAASEPAIHDRQLDYIIGVPLLVSALAINLLLPIRLSTLFWVWRVDLVSLPLFVAGAIALLFGVRALWRQRLPVAFLLCAWPFPYTMVLLRWLDTFTNVTLFGVNAGNGALHIARIVPGSDGSLFYVGTGPERFQLSVASACSGVNGMVGFLLVSIAFASIVTGSRWRKTLWLLAGLVCLWVMNVGRILLIFFAGNLWGERAAIDGLHPYLGLVTFNLGIVIMILAMGRFGLSFRTIAPRAAVAAPGSDPARGAADRPRARPAVPRVAVALVVVSLFGVVLGMVNSGFRSYDLVAGDLGAPRLVSFLGHPASISGWHSRRVATYAWSRRFFGDDSEWFRYAYSWNGTGRAPFSSSAPVVADVISTSDLESFSTYGIEACYTFHGFTLQDSRQVDLGGGVVGSVLSYWNASTRSDWTNVYWYWPVKARTGTRYERVNLMLTNSADAHARVRAPDPSFSRRLGLDVADAARGASRSDRAHRQMRRTQTFLVSYAHSLVMRQAADSRPAVRPVRAARVPATHATNADPEDRAG